MRVLHADRRLERGARANQLAVLELPERPAREEARLDDLGHPVPTLLVGERAREATGRRRPGRASGTRRRRSWRPEGRSPSCRRCRRRPGPRASSERPSTRLPACRSPRRGPPRRSWSRRRARRATRRGRSGAPTRAARAPRASSPPRRRAPRAARRRAPRARPAPGCRGSPRRGCRRRARPARRRARARRARRSRPARRGRRRMRGGRPSTSRACASATVLVERLAVAVQRMELVLRLRERPPTACDTLPGGLRVDVEQHRERAAREVVPRPLGEDGAPAERDDDRLAAAQHVPRDVLLERPEARFAAGREQLGDRRPRPRLDLPVEVDEAPAETGRHDLADTRLPRAHEPGERQVAAERVQRAHAASPASSASRSHGTSRQRSSSGA